MKPSVLGRSIPLLAALAVVILSTPVLADRGDDSKRKSKNGKTTGTVGGVEITLEYGRPSVKERKVWGGLVPYGKVWRTGADEATTISFGGDVEVQGKPLAAGTYSLFTVPGEEEWTIIFNKTAQQWGAFSYDAAQDALRVQVRPVAIEPVEALEFAIEGSDVVLKWEKLAVPFEVTAAP